MFDSLRRQPACQTTASARLKQFASTKQTQDEWIDESAGQPQHKPVAGSRLHNRRIPIVATAVVVVAAITVVGLIAARPEKEMPPPLPAAAVASSTHPSASASIMVSVVGKVAKPGLVTLPEGARVADAVRAAGGASDVDLLALNVARRLADGEQVYVGIPAQADAGPWIEAWNDDPKPFVWTKTADEILDNLARYCTRLNQLTNDSGH